MGPSPTGDLPAGAANRSPVIAARSLSRPEPASHDDDPRIVEAVLAGDRDAFRRLVERESVPVVRACHRVLGDLHEAEDAAQEAFVIAYRSLATWRGDGPFGAWLARIAVRVAIRMAARRRTVTRIEPTDMYDSEGPRLVIVAGPGGDPEGQALRGERERSIRTAVAHLDEPYREVVALRFFGERSLDEIATITGRPLGTVKTHLRRGLLRLRARIDDGEAR